MSEYQNYDDYNEFDEENEYDAIKGKKLTVGRIIKKTILYSFRLLALFVSAFLLIRVFSSGAPKSMKAFLWTDTSIEAYKSAPSDFEAFLYKRNDNLSSNGRFTASNVYFVPSIGEFQITVRYNNSTLKYLKEDFSLDSIPDGEPFVFILEDNLGNVYTEYKYTSDKKNIYNYRRLLFDGIDMNAEKTVEENGNEITKKFETLTLKAYYKDSVLLSEPYATITVYDTDHYHEPIELEKSPQKTPDMMNRTEYEIKEEPDKTDK